MTKQVRAGEGGEPLRRDKRCRWCRITLPSSDGPGRPREFCSQRCRQWDWVSRQRAEELHLSENELVVTRGELDDLKDRLYVLQCAVEDARRDLAAPRHTVKSMRETLEWVLEAADAVHVGDLRSGLGSTIRP